MVLSGSCAFDSSILLTMTMTMRCNRFPQVAAFSIILRVPVRRHRTAPLGGGAWTFACSVSLEIALDMKFRFFELEDRLYAR